MFLTRISVKQCCLMQWNTIQCQPAICTNLPMNKCVVSEVMPNWLHARLVWDYQVQVDTGYTRGKCKVAGMMSMGTLAHVVLHEFGVALGSLPVAVHHDAPTNHHCFWFIMSIVIAAWCLGKSLIDVHPYSHFHAPHIKMQGLNSPWCALFCGPFVCVSGGGARWVSATGGRQAKHTAVYGGIVWV